MMNRQREQGVALLLALGVLSLLLVSGLAFVTNALLAQKSAAAYRFRSQSQILGKSAVNRVMMLMRYYLEAGDTLGIGDLYSRSNAGISGQSSDIPSQAEQDQLTPAETSLLTAVVDNAVRNAPSTPRWEYMWDEYDANGRRTNDAKLVGRFAYWVLPGGSANFSEILRGNPNLTAPNSMSNWNRRRGFGIRELNISGSYLAQARLDELDDKFAGESFGSDPRTQDSLRANDYTTFLSMFANKPDLPLTNRNVIRRFLPPSGTEEEVYFYADSYNRDNFNPHRVNGLTKYHRFDLTRTDWNALGGSEKANQEELTGILLGTGVGDLPKERNAADTVNESTEATSNMIPALRRIHTAADHYGTLLIRRKQIAANLIDYCDTDNIPTSDSTDWATAAPKFTGHEKTPYINEIMISPSVAVKREEHTIPAAVPGGAPTYNYTYSAAIDLRMVAVELINMYEENFPNCDIAVKGECEMQITPDDQPMQTVKIAFDIPLTGTHTAPDTNGNYAYKIIYTEGAGTGVTLPNPWSEITTPAASTQRDPLRVIAKITSLKIEKVHLKITDGGEQINADYVRDLEFELTKETKVETTGTDPTQTIIFYPHIGAEVDDPRENLYQGATDNEALMNWKLIEQAGWIADKEDNPVTSSTTPGMIKGFTFNAKNTFCNPANPNGTLPERDMETADLPQQITSAYIANAPMKTLVELGAIHRAAKWQTINLRSSRCTPATPVNSALNDAGDSYQDGDAWILDQVKLTPKVQVPHRLYINIPPGKNSPESILLYAALFRGLSWDWNKHYNYTHSGSAIGENEARLMGDALAGRSETEKFFSRAELINFASGGNKLWNAYGMITPTTDVNAETVPALVSSLISFFPRPPDPVTLILAAQSIRDVGTTAGFSMSKLRADGSGSSDTATVVSGQFDYNGTTYFDEITSTSRFYVEIGTNPTTKKVDILRFEPLD